MEQMYIDIIENAFSRCFGLKQSLLKAVETDDKLLIKANTTSLSHQTGLRLSFIENNLPEIIELTKISHFDFDEDGDTIIN